MQINFKDGVDFERMVFGEPEEIISELLGTFNKPAGFKADVRRIIKSISRSKSHRKFPRTPIGEALYLGVKKSLTALGIEAGGLRLFSLLGTVADRYYETDALFYLPPSCGYECVVTIDAWLIDSVSLGQLRDYWIEMSEELVYSEIKFQGDLFAHNRILSEYLSSKDKPMRQDQYGQWVLSPEYKQLWERGYIPAIPDEMIDRPMMRPENHLIFTPYYLAKSWRRKVFTQLVANEFLKQLHL